MSSAKVVLYTHNTLKNGEHPIYLRVTKDRKTKYLKIGASCARDLWDDENNLPKKKHPLYKEISILIDKKRLDANRLLLGLEADEKDYSVEELKGKLRSSNRKKPVIEYFDEVIERLEKANRIGYANVFKSTKNSLVKFRKDRDFDFTDITTNFILKYEEDFLSRGVALNSVFVFMRTFKTLINYAKKDNIVKEDYNPFKDYNFTKFRRIKTKKRAIDKSQIKLIVDLETKPETSIFHSRNYFLFSFYNRGINFIDMAYLKWANIDGDKLDYTRKKTNERFNFRMLQPAIEILDYYRGGSNQLDEDYVFPILNARHKTAKSIDYRIDRVLKIVNEDLKTIANLTGIKGKLTTYVARHSFATILKRSGTGTAIISELMGHDSEKTTQIYLDSFENTILDEASKAIL